MVAQDLKKKIKSVSNTQKITNAMNLIATAKLKKEKDAFDGISDFYYEFHDTFSLVFAKSKEFKKLNYNSNKQTIWIIINSNLGLCGPYNYNINKLAASVVGPNDGIYVIGRKGYDFWQRNLEHNIELIDHFKIEENQVEISTMQQIIKQIMIHLNKSKYSSLKIIYTKFINQLTFSPTTLALLPIDEQMLVEKTEQLHDTAEIEFEPDEKELLDAMIPTYLSNVLYGALIESKVCENASRRNAMDMAIKNADTLITDYSNQYNRLRQARITNEIIEIVGASEAE